MKLSGKSGKCPYCQKISYFYTFLVKQSNKLFLLTQCPRCKKHDEVREATPQEAERLKSTPKKG